MSTSENDSSSVPRNGSSFTRKILESIKEEPQVSSTDMKELSRKSIVRTDSAVSPKRVCPATQGECPTKTALQQMMNSSARNSMISDWSSVYDGSRRSYSSILDKPFIFRRASSLQRAIAQNDDIMAQLYLDNANNALEMEEGSTVEASVHTSSITPTSVTETERFTDSKSQTESTSITESRGGSARKRLRYLMGIPADGEHEGEGQDSRNEIEEIAIDEEPLSGETEAMKHAQRYLRIHRIFEFYQYLVTHLLSATPDNPINFLLDLLDRCIVYRAGMGIPPMLYDRKHLIALFNLMDRMRTGYIDKEQYVTGMKTLGICSYNPDPPLIDGMVYRDFFVEEAYENLVSMLNDVIRRRWIYFNTQPPPIKTPPPTPQYSTRSGRTNTTTTRKTYTSSTW